MHITYIGHIGFLDDCPIDIACVPLDPRQEKYYAGGMLYFLNLHAAHLALP